MKLTREQIENMPVGYGIRKLLGEKVMDWNQQAKWWVGTASVICPVSVWKPDERIDTAWDVVTKMIYIGYHFEMQINDSCGNKVGHCSFAKINNDEWSFEERYKVFIENNEPLAICRAALIAMMDIAQ